MSPRSPSRPFPPGQLGAEDTSIPQSPPPSFRSRASSRRNSSQQDHQHNEEHDRVLDDAFAAPSDDESENDDDDDATSGSRRLIRNNERQNSSDDDHPGRSMDRRVTEINMFMPGASQGATTGRVYGGGNSTRDGVFANISAKPTPGEDLEEKPPVCLAHQFPRLDATTDPPILDLRTGRCRCHSILLGNHHPRSWPIQQ